MLEYVEEQGDTFLSAMESSFATSSGMTCESDMEVVGNGFVVTIKINELDELPEETKKAMQDAYDALDESFDESLEMMQTELPELEYYEVNVCEKDGDLIATIHAGE